jgi:hypothetical protein
VKELLLADDLDGVLQVARDQVDAGAHLLDVSVALVERTDESETMRALVKLLSQGVDAPLMVDTTEVETMQFNTTVDDVAHWAGISPEKCRQVINHFINQRRVELFPDKIVVRNINDFARFVKSRRRKQD